MTASQDVTRQIAMSSADESLELLKIKQQQVERRAAGLSSNPEPE